MARKNRIVTYLTDQEAAFVRKVRQQAGAETDSDGLRFVVQSMKMITEGQAFVFPAAPGIRTMVKGQYQLQTGGKAKKGE